MPEISDVLVTGGTGVLGARVVQVLRERSRPVRVLTRQEAPGLPEGVRAISGDLSTAAGLSAALDGVGAVVHCASNPRRHREVDVQGTRGLVAAARRLADPPHLVLVSIVGCDQISNGYYRSKALAELALAESGLPWTVLRATQFHDLVFYLAYTASALPLVPVPRGLTDQPVDVATVAERLVDLALGEPAQRAGDIGGPEVLPAEEILRIVQRATGRERRLVTVPAPGRLLAEVRGGAHLVPEHRAGPTFAEYVARHVHGEPGSARVDLPYRWRK